MYKKLLLFVLLCLMLCGCGSEFSGATYTINVPVTNDSYITVLWPEEIPLKYTDNATYWEFEDQSVLYTSDSPEISYDKDKDTFIVGRKPEERKVIYTGVALSKKQFEDIINSAEVTTNRADYSEDLEIPSTNNLEFDKKEIVIDDHGMAMPAEFLSKIRDTSNFYSASLLLDDTESYLTAFIIDRDFETFKQEIYNMVCTGTPLSQWYYNKDSGIFVIKSGKKCAVAKAIRSNEWYVYLGTFNYSDYMLSGVELVTYNG